MQRATVGHPMSGQAIVELALVAPIMLMLLLGAFDVGLALFNTMRLQNAAQTIAATPEAFDAELDRIGMGCEGAVTEYEGYTLVALDCPNPLPLTGFVAKTLHAEASGPLPEGTP